MQNKTIFFQDIEQFFRAIIGTAINLKYECFIKYYPKKKKKTTKTLKEKHDILLYSVIISGCLLIKL